MKFEIIPSEIFLKQLKKLAQKQKNQIKKKIKLIKQNPFRFKSIRSKKFSKIFRIRLNFGGNETRLIYVILGSKIIIVCLLDRKNEYKDLEKYLSTLNNK